MTEIVRADGTFMWRLDFHYAGLKPCATRSPVPMALSCGSRKTSIPKPNVAGKYDVVICQSELRLHPFQNPMP